MPYKDKSKLYEAQKRYRQRKRDKALSDAVWSGIRVRYPPFSDNGAYYRTKYVSKVYNEATHEVTVTMDLIPEEVKTE